MKIFEFKKEETDWVFAEYLAQAKECYLIETGCGDLKGYTIKELPKKKMERSLHT